MNEKRAPMPARCSFSAVSSTSSTSVPFLICFSSSGLPLSAPTLTL